MIKKLKLMFVLNIIIFFIFSCVVTPKVDSVNEIPVDCKLITK